MASIGTLLPAPWMDCFDLNGDPISGAQLTFFLAGTSTPTTTYNDVNLTTPNAVPLLADAAGRAGPIYLSPGASVKLVLKDAAGVLVRSLDFISAVPLASGNVDVTGIAGETLAAGAVVYLSDGSGGKVAGQWYKADSAATYSSSTAVAVGMTTAAIVSGASGTIRIGGLVPGLTSLVVGTTYYVGTAGALTSTAPAFVRAVGIADTTVSLILTAIPAVPISNNGIAHYRLTLTSGTAVTVSDVTAATTVYVTPYKGNRIALYDGTRFWVPITFAETPLALGTLVNAQAYDVFGYNNAGVLGVEALEWANATVTMTIAAPGVVTWVAHGLATGNSITFTTTGTLPTGVVANTQYFVTVVDADTFKLSTTLALVAAGTFITTSVSQSGVHTGHQPQARATALVLQDGVLSKTGALTRRYLGSFLTTSTTTTEDSFAKRFVSNYANRAIRVLRVNETTDSWTYATATMRQSNAAVGNQLATLVGVAEVALTVEARASWAHTGIAGFLVTSIGEDSSALTAAGTQLSETITDAATNIKNTSALLRKYPTVGYHAYTWLEQASGATATIYGDNGAANAGPQSGISGTLEG